MSGDAALVAVRERYLLGAIIDGLGHGPAAHAAAQLARDYLATRGSDDLRATLPALHQYLLGSRGVAIGLCVVHLDDYTLRYAGMGNTVFRKFGTREVRLVSREATLGQVMRTPFEQRLTLDPGDIVLLYTDGVRAHFTQREARSLLTLPAAELARAIVHNYGKSTDDAGCIAMRLLP